MYQIQEITINRSAEAAVKFYTEVVLPYIAWISTQEEEETRMSLFSCEEKTVISHVNAEIETHFTDSTITVHLEEDWEDISQKSEDDESDWKFNRICREFLNRKEQLADNCDYRYERRSISYDGDDNANYVEIYEPLKMTRPICAYGNFFELHHLPVNRLISLEQLPERTWYPAMPTVIFQWLTGWIENPDWTPDNNKQVPVMIPVSERYTDYAWHDAPALKHFFENGGFGGNENEVDLEDGRVLSTSEYRFATVAYSYTSAEIKNLVERMKQFYQAVKENNHRVFEDAKQKERNLATFQMLFCSDQFDAFEIYLDEDTSEFVCRFYENGTTDFAEVPDTILCGRGYSISS
jgi:hypothetical protein